MASMNEEHRTEEASVSDASQYDYIIVGSGAGGAPLAARLARAGKKVLVIEAGSNHTQLGPREPSNEITRVPLLHAASTEHPDLSWRFFVEHYGQLPNGIAPDPKRYIPNVATGENQSHEGIFYPRAAGIGGCTIHNAMITIAGPDSDWDDLASFLGDPSWNGRRMRVYFQRLEHNDYMPVPDSRRRRPFQDRWHFVKNAFRFLLGYRPDTTSGKHGFSGWLHTSFPDLSIGLHDKQLVKMIKAALWQAKREGMENAWSLVRTLFKGKFLQALDPNHAETQASSPEGVALIPLAVYGNTTTIHRNGEHPYAILGYRSSPRDFLLDTLAQYPENLTIWPDCLVTKVLFDDDCPLRAVGVELLRGKRLYRAHVSPSEAEGTPEKVYVRKEDNVNGEKAGEVILCGGAFNTPQLLMLSGIGDKDELKAIPATDSNKTIDCRVHLPGVGKNLQDRYEVSVVSEMAHDFSTLNGASFDITQPDPHLRQWREEGTGLYASNGAVLGIFKRSRPELSQPDLFIFGVPADFRGYSVGYSKVRRHNHFTWVILKSHTRNPGGIVKLRSTDPRDTPLINFHYFGTSRESDCNTPDPDLQALVHGVKFVRNILRSAKSIVRAEVHPGPNFASNSATADWIRRDAWGHHACGTCRMGPDGDPNAVLDSRFRVRGVQGLRVVDASIFPSIPGYFIATNIYMASEKAADVIIEDAADQSGLDEPEYPSELRRKEAQAIESRRAQAKLLEEAASAADGAGTAPANRPGFTATDFPKPLLPDGQWEQDVTGLALSGGGIRSATHALGILQTLARKHLLRRIDFLSTVSGGGYVGAFLGRFYDRLRPDAVIGQAPITAVPPADYVEQELVSPRSPVIDWLRSHGNYIAPTGQGDGRLNFAIFLRNLLSVHLVVGLPLFALFGIANAIRYGLFDNLLAGIGLALNRHDMPIGHLVESLIGPWFSPWFILFELLLLFFVAPRIIGYWLVSQDKHESYKAISLTILFFVAGLLLYLGVENGLAVEPLILGLAMLSSLAHVELAWARGRQREEAVGTGGTATQRLRTRNYLTYDLGLALLVAGHVLGFTLIDSLAHGLQEWKLQGNITYAQAFAALGAAAAAALPVARLISNFLRNRGDTTTGSISRILKRDMAAGILAVVLFTLPLLLYSFAAHAVYEGGTELIRGLLATLFACALTIGFAFPSALTFVNRSSLSQTYAARLARAYLGASNPARHRPEGSNVTEVIPGDDIASIRNYQPHAASGPFHLINVTINETVDYGSRIRKRDRQGLNLAVSSLGMTIGEKWHSLWSDASAAAQAAGGNDVTGLDPVGHPYGTQHPLVDELGRPADRAEMLSLRQWIGISGAAIDPGRGRTTNLGMALLTGLVNLRTGYWWDSGIAESARGGFPQISLPRRILYLVPRFFATQSLLLYEWLAHFPGPWERFWHISDGGFFENLGGYELVRRRLPRIIICDTGADPGYEFADFAEFVRKVRIDFGARVESLTKQEITQLVPKEIRSYIGTLDELKPGATGFAARHAALCWVHYPQPLGSRRSILLYLKASLTGDESPDIQNYYSAHPEFPHESTADQFFDEAQWESYRKLGEHAANQVFFIDWFWKIPLADSQGGAP